MNLCSEGRSALVGWTGLVGSSLLRRREFETRINSKNATELSGQFEHVVFSAARAEKWRANSDPSADAAHIDELIALLKAFTTDQLVLISTVDVYADPIGVDESTPVDPGNLNPYGLGRARLERAAREIHRTVLVLRLPGLFGRGLKKNVIFDLLHDNEVARIQPASAYQYYNLERLADDVDGALQAGLDLLNVVSEPMKTEEIMSRVFGRKPAPAAAPIVNYDVRTRYSTRLGKSGPYLYDKDSVLSELTRFVSEEGHR